MGPDLPIRLEEGVMTKGSTSDQIVHQLLQSALTRASARCVEKAQGVRDRIVPRLNRER